MDTKQYLKKAEKIYTDKDILKVIDFFKENKKPELEKIIKLKGFNKTTYLSDKTKFIIKKTGLKEFEKIIHTFCYAVNEFRREKAREDKEKEILDGGFKKIFRNQKELNDLKVICILDIDKIGILGGFTDKEEIKGKLYWDENREFLALIPSRCRTKGHIIRDYAFIREIEK